MEDFLKILPLILGFLAILFLAYLVTRYMGSKVYNLGTTKYMRVLEKVFLGNDKSLCIIQIGQRIFVVGVTNHQISIISEINETDLVSLTDHKESSFNSLLERYIKKPQQKNKDPWQGADKVQQIKNDLKKRI